MEAYWNKLVLDRPPTTSWRCSSNQFDCQGFTKAINKAVTELESQNFFKIEAALLSRLIYRMKSKLRSDKGLKNMEKINRALLNYLKLSLENDYKYLRDNTECDGDVVALPSRQMLQYALVRTQGFAKLMCRIEYVARCAGEFFKARIDLGQAWNVSVVAYSVISRIWLLSRYLTKRCCIWYSRMYVYLNELTMMGISWLPDNYQFPKDLKTWLFVPWIDEDIQNRCEKDSKSSIDSIFNLITRDENADEDLEIIFNETKDALEASHAAQSKEIGKITVLRNKIDSPDVPQTEIGERISRDDFAADLAKIAKDTARPIIRKGKVAKEHSDYKLKKKKLLSVDDLETEEDLVEFVNSESYPGLDKLQWKMIRKNVRKFLVKLKRDNDDSGTKKQGIAVKKIIRTLRKWID